MANLRVESITVRYGSVVALNKVSLRIDDGELVAIVGPNGAGKSSLLNAIAGVVRSSAGSIHMNGHLLDRLPPEQRSLMGITLVPEDRGIFKSMTVADNLRLATASGRTPDYRAALDEVFDLFPILSEYRRKLAGQLSGGEQQMLAIGRALIARPQLLLLDEPSLGLAPMLVGQMIGVVVELHRRGVTVLIVEQHAMKAIAVADRGYVLANSRVVFEGERDVLIGHRSVIDAYLGGGAAAKDRARAS